MSPFFVLFEIFNSIFYPTFQIPINYYVLVIIESTLIMIGTIVFIYSERILILTHHSSKFVTTRFYACVRHPMDASRGLGIFLSIFCLINSSLLFLNLFVYYLVIRFFIKKEEKHLFKKFGKEYIHYKRYVNLFFPKLKNYKFE